MTVLSSLRCMGSCLNRTVISSGQLKLLNNSCVKEWPHRLMSSHRVFPLTPSRFQYKKFKDIIHLYFAVGLIPIGLLVGWANIFIGPATLTEIPEGYNPKHWEYYKHPITRFIARYIHTSDQQEYEKFLHYLYEEDLRVKLKLTESKIDKLMRERTDYHGFYFVPYTHANYERASKEKEERYKELIGNN